ncbi:bifunctional DNA primase/polymerase [Nonomuraea recticatena]|uniref:bifunctional DNA primase/polymerase n=1 Tax=Nonomuraea recticatena TaxID=46178 RepID=UPI003617B806
MTLRFHDDDPPPERVPAQSLAIARWCAQQGWPVHPLAPGSKTPTANCLPCRQRKHQASRCPCLKQGRWCHSFLAATLDDQVISAWWGANPRFGVGVSCGPANLVVIDIDSHPTSIPARDRLLPGITIDARVDLTGLATGYHTLALLAALHGEPSPADDAKTLRVRTPSQGLHVWYRADPAQSFLSSVGSGGGRALAWQVDVRAGGGYIIAPGTRIKDGAYSIVGNCYQPAPLPSWLAAELIRTEHLAVHHTHTAQQPQPLPPRARLAVTQAGGGNSVAGRVLARLLADVTACGALPEGAGFTTKLNRAAYTAGGLVASGYLTHGDAETLLTEAAQHARPGQDRRFGRVIASGLTAGVRRPLHL